MADYIYLLQNRLTPAQRRALEAVREAARARTMPVFLVGGAVRDLSSGAPVRDLDFAVQGDIAGLVQDLTSGGATVAGENPALSSVFLIFPGGVRAEVGPTLAVAYPKPGKPEAQPAAILEDLRRRGFTANAMAISLNEGSYGLLLDPLNGIADMENRELRLVSNYGFIEQPALLLRAARLSGRLGWTLEERTQTRYETGKEERYIDALPAFDRGYELEEVFHEDDPLAIWEHLSQEGWSSALFAAWNPAKADREGLDRVRDLIGQMEQMGIFVDPSPVFFPLLTAKLTGKDLTALKGVFPRQGFVAQIDSLEARSKELANQLTSKNAAPSETWKLLFSSEPEIILWLAYSSRSAPVQAKFKSFLSEWPQARQRLPYALMQEMRITPDLPGYDQLLEDLFFAQIDGKLATPEATRAFLEPFSPPAPTPQAAPRRRPAKSTRRGRKAVEETIERETAEQDSSGVSGTSAAAQPVPEPQAAGPVPPVKKAAAEPVPARKTPAAPAAKKAVSAEKAAPAQPPAPAVKEKKAQPPAPTPAKSAKKAPAKVATKKAAARQGSKPVPAKKTAKPPAKAVPAAKKVVAKHPPVAAKSQKAKNAPPAAKKKQTPAKRESAKTAGAAKKGSTRVTVAAKGGSTHKSAAKRAPAKAAPSRKAAAPAKKSPPAKKGASKPGKKRPGR